MQCNLKQKYMARLKGQKLRDARVSQEFARADSKNE